MSTELVIRKAIASDIYDFTNIKASAYEDDRTKTVLSPEEMPEWYNGDWYVGLSKPNIIENKRLMEQFECYMICLGGKSIGIFWIHCEETDSLTLENFCIQPEYQGKGYGKQALQLIEELCPSNKRWLLTTPCFCKRNCHLYEKKGYKKIGLVSEGTVIVYEKSMT